MTLMVAIDDNNCRLQCPFQWRMREDRTKLLQQNKTRKGSDTSESVSCGQSFHESEQSQFKPRFSHPVIGVMITSPSLILTIKIPNQLQISINVNWKQGVFVLTTQVPSPCSLHSCRMIFGVLWRKVALIKDSRPCYGVYAPVWNELVTLWFFFTRNRWCQSLSHHVTCPSQNVVPVTASPNVVRSWPSWPGSRNETY